MSGGGDSTETNDKEIQIKALHDSIEVKMTGMKDLPSLVVIGVLNLGPMPNPHAFFAFVAGSS